MTVNLSLFVGKVTVNPHNLSGFFSVLNHINHP